jgi:hypothetical protein
MDLKIPLTNRTKESANSSRSIQWKILRIISEQFLRIIEFVILSPSICRKTYIFFFLLALHVKSLKWGASFAGHNTFICWEYNIKLIFIIRYVFSTASIAVSICRLLALLAPKLPVSSWFAHESMFLYHFEGCPVFSQDDMWSQCSLCPVVSRLYTRIDDECEPILESIIDFPHWCIRSDILFLCAIIHINQGRISKDENFINILEAIMPENAMIFQLPYVPLPEYPQVAQCMVILIWGPTCTRRIYVGATGAMRDVLEIIGKKMQRACLSGKWSEHCPKQVNGIYIDSYGYQITGLN